MMKLYSLIKITPHLYFSGSATLNNRDAFYRWRNQANQRPRGQGRNTSEKINVAGPEASANRVGFWWETVKNLRIQYIWIEICSCGRCTEEPALRNMPTLHGGVWIWLAQSREAPNYGPWWLSCAKPRRTAWAKDLGPGGASCGCCKRCRVSRFLCQRIQKKVCHLFFSRNSTARKMPKESYPGSTQPGPTQRGMGNRAINTQDAETPPPPRTHTWT